MQTFEFQENQNSPQRRKFGLASLVTAVALLAVVGTTYAANIGINTNSNNTVNFGQGIAQTVACDNDGIDISPASSDPQNIGSEAGVSATWYLATVTISGVSNACDGKKFTIAAYDISANGLQLAQVQNETGVEPTSDPTYDIGFTLNSTNGWTALESGIKDFSVTGTWTNDNNNTVVLSLWFPNGNQALLTGWNPGTHVDSVGLVSADLAYFTVETTE